MYEITAKADKEVEIKMYGTIAQWSKVNASEFSAAVDAALKNNPKTIVFPTHSPGGDVDEGLAMTSTLDQLKAKEIKTICRIDGLAASMMAVFASACDETEIAPLARMMVHEGRGGRYGTSSELREVADQIDARNEDMATIHAKRTGKEKQWIIDNWMSKGKDTWFNAEQAYKAGLATRKVSAVVKEVPKLAAIAAMDSMGWLEIAAHYDANYNEFFKPQNRMEKDEIIALLGLSKDATDAQIKAALADYKMKADAAAKASEDAAAAAAKSDPSKAAVVEGVVALGKERGMDEKQLATLRIVAGVDVKAAIDMLPSTEKKTEEPKNPVNLKETIEALKNGGSSTIGVVNAADQKTWDWNEWSKHPKEFAALLDSKPEEYIKVFSAEFKYTPTVDELKSPNFKR